MGLFNIHDYDQEARMQNLLERGSGIFHDYEEEALYERMIEDGLIPDPHEKPAERNPKPKKNGSNKSPKEPRRKSE